VGNNIYYQSLRDDPNNSIKEYVSGVLQTITLDKIKRMEKAILALPLERRIKMVDYGYCSCTSCLGYIHYIILNIQTIGEMFEQLINNNLQYVQLQIVDSIYIKRCVKRDIVLDDKEPLRQLIH
jgi:hypothetical protein